MTLTTPDILTFLSAAVLWCVYIIIKSRIESRRYTDIVGKLADLRYESKRSVEELKNINRLIIDPVVKEHQRTYANHLKEKEVK